MDCACFDPVSDMGDGSCEFYSVKIVKARKKHKCYECGHIIEIGESYEYATGKWDGDFDVFKTCDDCQHHPNHHLYIQYL